MALASQSSLALVLFLVLVGACPLTAYPGYPGEVFPIIIGTEHVRKVGEFAVDEYNKKGEPHLYFIAVVNGTLAGETFHSQVWHLELKAANCSSPSDTRAALYLAQILEDSVASPPWSNSFHIVLTLETFYRK